MFYYINNNLKITDEYLFLNLRQLFITLITTAVFVNNFAYLELYFLLRAFCFSLYINLKTQLMPH